MVAKSYLEKSKVQNFNTYFFNNIFLVTAPTMMVSYFKRKLYAHPPYQFFLHLILC